MLYQPGDRLQHYTGAVYHVHEVYPTGNCLVGIGSTDRVLATKAELQTQTLTRGQIGKIPYAVMGFIASPHWHCHEKTAHN
jgi:hypothetical protein